MHYKCLLITSEFPTKEVISDALAPFREEIEDNDKPFTWDWYQIGGRYNGSLKLKVNIEDKKYNWGRRDRDERNGRVFWSYLLTQMKGFANESILFSEEDYFSSMGTRDGYLYVDGALIADILNFNEMECYCCIDKFGGAFAVTDEDFDIKLKAVIEESSDCYATVIDLHD